MAAGDHRQVKEAAAQEGVWVVAGSHRGEGDAVTAHRPGPALTGSRDERLQAPVGATETTLSPGCEKQHKERSNLLQKVDSLSNVPGLESKGFLTFWSSSSTVCAVNKLRLRAA